MNLSINGGKLLKILTLLFPIIHHAGGGNRTRAIRFSSQGGKLFLAASDGNHYMEIATGFDAPDFPTFFLMEYLIEEIISKLAWDSPDIAITLDNGYGRFATGAYSLDMPFSNLSKTWPTHQMILDFYAKSLAKGDFKIKLSAIRARLPASEIFQLTKGDLWFDGKHLKTILAAGKKDVSFELRERTAYNQTSYVLILTTSTYTALLISRKS